MDAFELVGKLTIDSTGIAAGLNAADTSGFSAWGVAAGNLASSAFRKTFAAGVQFAKDVVNKTMDFESTMSHVESVTQATATEMDAITAKARELGGSTIYTAEQVGEAMFYMGQAGWKTEQILAGIGGVMDLAAASGDDLSRVSDIVTDSLTAFGMTAEDTGHFVDVLAQTARNSNTNVSQVGEAFKYLAPLAGTLGYTIDDVGTAMGILANNGIKSSMAGTSLRTILSTLIGPSKEAAESMDALGISLYDDNGRVKSLLEVIGDFRTAFAESGFDIAGKSIEEIAAKTDELAIKLENAQKRLEAGEISEKKYSTIVGETKRELADFINTNANFLEDLTNIGGLRGISALMALMKSTDTDYNNLTQAIVNSTGAAAEMAEVQRDNLKGDVTLLNSAVDDLQLTVGNMANDTLRDITQNATSFVNSLSTALTAGRGMLNADQMLRVMEKYEDWNKTSNLQFITKSNKAAELYRTIAEELEAAGATDEEVGNLINRLTEAGNADQVLEVIKTLQDAQSEVTALGAEADAVSGDYDLNFHINTHGSVPNPSSYVPSGGVGGGGKDTYVALNAKGNWDVPYDNYPALLHRNEMVLTTTQARQYREGERNYFDPSAISEAVRGAVMDLTMELNNETVGRVFGNATTRRVRNNISQINRRHQYGYGG